MHDSSVAEERQPAYATEVGEAWSTKGGGRRRRHPRALRVGLASASITRQINWFESPVDEVAPLCADRKRRAKPVSE